MRLLLDLHVRLLRLLRLLRLFLRLDLFSHRGEGLLLRHVIHERSLAPVKALPTGAHARHAHASACREEVLRHERVEHDLLAREDIVERRDGGARRGASGPLDGDLHRALREVIRRRVLLLWDNLADSLDPRRDHLRIAGVQAEPRPWGVQDVDALDRNTVVRHADGPDLERLDVVRHPVLLRRPQRPHPVFEAVPRQILLRDVVFVRQSNHEVTSVAAPSVLRPVVLVAGEWPDTLQRRRVRRVNGERRASLVLERPVHVLKVLVLGERLGVERARHVERAQLLARKSEDHHRLVHVDVRGIPPVRPACDPGAKVLGLVPFAAVSHVRLRLGRIREKLVDDPVVAPLPLESLLEYRGVVVGVCAESAPHVAAAALHGIVLVALTRGLVDRTPRPQLRRRARPVGCPAVDEGVEERVDSLIVPPVGPLPSAVGVGVRGVSPGVREAKAVAHLVVEERLEFARAGAAGAAAQTAAGALVVSLLPPPRLVLVHLLDDAAVVHVPRFLRPVRLANRGEQPQRLADRVEVVEARVVRRVAALAKRRRVVSAAVDEAFVDVHPARLVQEGLEARRRHARLERLCDVPGKHSRVLRRHRVRPVFPERVVRRAEQVEGDHDQRQ